MALAEGVNVSDIWQVVYPTLADKLGPLVTIFKAVGIAVLVYLFILIVRGIINIKNARRIKRIEEKVDMLLAIQNKKLTPASHSRLSRK